MRTPVVAGNWKMNGSRASISSLLEGINAELDAGTRAEILVFPPYVYLDVVKSILAESGIGVGAQDVDHRDQGAITGGVAVDMLTDLGCTHALVGHSERRSLFGETDERVADKFEACLNGGLTPIVCIGESLDERQSGQTLAVVTRQLRAVTSQIGADRFEGAIVAYEPVWAIGTGESATPAQAEEVHAAVREELGQMGQSLAMETRILYGGSVTAENAEALFANENVDGALVGGASLKPADFVEICRTPG